MKKRFFLIFTIVFFFTNLANSQNDWKFYNQQMSDYYYEGNYEKAIESAEKALKLTEEEYGSENEYYIFDLNNLAFLYSANSQFEESEIKYLEVLVSKADIFGENSSEFAKTVNDLAAMFYNSGQYEKALRDFNKALKLNEHLKGKENYDYVLTLANIGVLYTELDSLDKAEKCLIESLFISEKIVGEKDIDYALTLNDLANVYMQKHDYKKADSCYYIAIDIFVDYGDEYSYYSSFARLIETYVLQNQFDKSLETAFQVLETIENNIGKDNEFYAQVTEQIGIIYEKKSNYKEARTYLSESLEIYEKLYGKRSSNYIENLNSLAVVNINSGLYQTAEFQLNGVLDFYSDEIGNVSNEYALSLTNFGVLNYYNGNYKKSEYNYIKAKNIYAQLFGENNLQYATVLNGLAVLYYQMGLFEKSEENFTAALKIFTDFKSENPLDYALCLGNYADLNLKKGDFITAIQNLNEALQLRKGYLGENNYEYSHSLSTLAKAYFLSEMYLDAEVTYERVINIRKEILGEQHTEYANALENIGLFYLGTRNYSKAETYLKKSLEIKSEIFGQRSYNYWITLNNYLAVEWCLEKEEEIMKLLVESNDIINNILIENFSFLSEKEREIFYEQIYFIFDVYNSYMKKFDVSSNDLIIMSLNNEILHKSMLLQTSLALSNLINSSTDSTVLINYSELMNIKQMLVREYSLPLDERELDTDSLENICNSCEKNLINRVNELYDEDFLTVSNLGKTDWSEIKSNLNENEAIIEFSNFSYYNKTWTDTTLYYAFILTKKMKNPVKVFLFEEDKLQQLMNKELDEDLSDFEFIKNLYPTNGNEACELYNLIWKPLDEYLQNVETINIIPSGLINKISFDGIAIDENNLLSDKYNINYYSTSAQILKNKEIFISDIYNVALYGGVDYNIDTTQMKLLAEKQIDKSDLEIASRSLDFFSDTLSRGGIWNYLSGSYDEVNNINEILQKKNVPINYFTGQDATEEAFKQMSNNSPSIIHLATHGFYFPDDESTKSAFSFLGKDNQYVFSSNPLLRSGIILAGGNNIWSDMKIPAEIDDGVLSAYEISTLNLNNTKLAIFSACQTGLGDVKGNEGVYGLRRGLKMAGVDYIIISLWQVPDVQTKELMSFFYENFASGMELKKAFKEAQNQMKEKYKLVDGSVYAWAAFILIE